MRALANQQNAIFYCNPAPRNENVVYTHNTTYTHTHTSTRRMCVLVWECKRPYNAAKKAQ